MSAMEIHPSNGLPSRFSFDPESQGDGYAAEAYADELENEFAVSVDELYEGVPFVGKLFRLVDGQRRFAASFSPEEPGTLDTLTQRRPGRKPFPAGDYLLRTTAPGRSVDLAFCIDGPEEDAPKPVPQPHAGPTTPSRFSPEQEEAIEERIRMEERALARRKYARELEDAERELSNVKRDRDAAERKLRDASDLYDQVRSRLREAEAATAEARAQAAETRAQLVREHAEELTRLERKQFNEVERLRRDIAKLEQKTALSDLRAELGGDGPDTISKVLDFVKGFEIPEGVLQMIAERMGGSVEYDDGPAQLAGPPSHADFHHSPAVAPSGAPNTLPPTSAWAEPQPASYPQPDASGALPFDPRLITREYAQRDSAHEATETPRDEAGAAESGPTAPAAAEPTATAETMLAQVLETALGALRRTVDMEPAQFAGWIERQMHAAQAHGLDLSGAAGPLLVGLATEAAAAAVAPERVASYLAPTLDTLAPQAKRFLHGPSSFLAQALCQMAEAQLDEQQTAYLIRVLDAYKAQR